MSSSRRLVSAGLVALLLIVLVVGFRAWPLIRVAPEGLSAVAKITCSNIFLSGRTLPDVQAHELTVAGDQPFSVEVDREEGMVTASLFGLYEKSALYREGLGCTLLNNTTRARLVNQAAEFTEQLRGSDELESADLPSAGNRPGLERALDTGFMESAEGPRRHTRAILAIHKGEIVAERYGKGYTRTTPQLGWSMTKSVNNALVGVLVGEGKLDVAARAPVPEWADNADARHRITLDHLLRMSSGLDFAEVYEEDLASDAGRMLFSQFDAGAFAADKPLRAQPGTLWVYSSGTTNILSRIVRHAVAGSDADYFAFPRRALFARIGVTSAVMEPDPSGTFVASSYMYATPRDWARLGLLYLHDGVWDGERILPEGWVAYSRTQAPAAGPGYGAQFWLNEDSEGHLAFPYLPPDMYYMSGHDGQFVVIIPSEDLVIVRMGFSSGVRSAELLAFAEELIDALPRDTVSTSGAGATNMKR